MPAHLTPGSLAKNLSETSKFNVLPAFDYFEQDPIQSANRSYSFILDHNKFGHFSISLRQTHRLVTSSMR
jgi:hypothetical protein